MEERTLREENSRSRKCEEDRQMGEFSKHHIPSDCIHDVTALARLKNFYHRFRHKKHLNVQSHIIIQLVLHRNSGST
jgi:hypothetical protein